jgi:hypothetical protein
MNGPIRNLRVEGNSTKLERPARAGTLTPCARNVLLRVTPTNPAAIPLGADNSM